MRPDDVRAKQNLEYCLKLKREQKQDSTGQQQPPPQQQPKDSPKQQPQQAQAQQAQAQKDAISKEQADRMLQAVQSRERQNLKNQPKPQQQQGAGGKDW